MMTMHFSKIELHNVRGVRYLKAAHLPETGVLVIHGPNEAGKSTVMDAVAIALSESYKSKRDKPAGSLSRFGSNWLQSVDSGEAPEISLDMTIGDVEFSLTKRFLKSAKAELSIHSPRRESLTNQAAEERLKEIIEHNVDVALLKALFMRQDELDSTVAAAGLPSFTAALEQAAGGDAPADHSAGEDTELLERIAAEYGQYYTKTGKPTGALDKAQKRNAAAQEALRAAQARIEEWEAQSVEHERAAQAKSRAMDNIPNLEADVEAKRALLEKARECAQKLTQAAESVENHRQHMQAATREWEQRTELLSRVEQLDRAALELAPQVQEAHELAKAQVEAREAAQQEVSAVLAARDASKTAHSAAQAEVQRLSELQRFMLLAARIAELSQLDATLGVAQQAAVQRGRVVTDQDVDKAQQAHNELVVCKKLVESSAAKLHLTSAQDRTITVNGTAVELAAGQDHIISLNGGTTVDIAGVVARYSAGTLADTSAQDDLAAAIEAMENILAELHCVDLAHVRAKRQEHSEIEHALHQAQDALEVALGGDDLAQLRAEYEALCAHHGGILAEEADVEHLLEQAQSSLECSAKDLDAAQSQVENAQGKLAALHQSTAERELIIVQENHKHIVATLHEAREQLEAARVTSSDEELEQTLEQTRLAHDAAAQSLEAVKADNDESDPELALRLLEGAQAALASEQEGFAAADRKIAALEASVQAAQGAADVLFAAEMEARRAAKALEAVERRAAAAQRLLDVMIAHRDAARSRYAAPFAQQLSQLAKVVYGPGVEFGLSDDLHVTARFSGQATVGVADLSGGAREQLALITRFAIAGMIAEQQGGGGVPIVVDDALGSSDATRVELMATLFAQAGKHSQVIVLTCVPERFNRIPGRIEYDIEELKRS